MGKMGKKQVLCILLGIILAVAGYLVEKRDGALEDGNRLNRYAYGEGERQQEVWVRGLCGNMRKRMQKKHCWRREVNWRI